MLKYILPSQRRPHYSWNVWVGKMFLTEVSYARQWNISISLQFKVILNNVIYFLWWQSWIFSLQCHMILQESFWYDSLVLENGFIFFVETVIHVFQDYLILIFFDLGWNYLLVWLMGDKERHFISGIQIMHFTFHWIEMLNC